MLSITLDSSREHCEGRLFRCVPICLESSGALIKSETTFAFACTSFLVLRRRVPLEKHSQQVDTVTPVIDRIARFRSLSFTLHPLLFESIQHISMKVAIAQMTSKATPEGNFEVCRKMAHKAAANGAEMVFWPESTDVIFDDDYPKEEERKKYDESRLKKFVDQMAGLAKEVCWFLWPA
jgi:hypothetical protein